MSAASTPSSTKKPWEYRPGELCITSAQVAVTNARLAALAPRLAVAAATAPAAARAARTTARRPPVPRPAGVVLQRGRPLGLSVEGTGACLLTGDHPLKIKLHREPPPSATAIFDLIAISEGADPSRLLSGPTTDKR